MSGIRVRASRCLLAALVTMTAACAADAPRAVGPPAPIEELSIVSAPYSVDGQVVGTLGVIGPTRMPYDRMIQIVDITSKLVSNALSHNKG